jgi:hypothetical protein
MTNSEKSPELKMRDIATSRDNGEGFIISHRNGWVGRAALRYYMKQYNLFPKKAVERKFEYIKEIDPQYAYLNSRLESQDLSSYFGIRYNDPGGSVKLDNIIRPCLRSNSSRSYLKYDHPNNPDSSLYIVFSRHPQAGRATFRSEGKPLIAAEMMMRHPDGLLRPTGKEIQKIEFNKTNFSPLVIGQDNISYCHQNFVLSEAAYISEKTARNQVSINKSSVGMAVSELKNHDPNVGSLMADFLNAPFVDFRVTDKVSA